MSKPDTYAESAEKPTSGHANELVGIFWHPKAFR